jgi:hypothetical protein
MQVASAPVSSGVRLHRRVVARGGVLGGVRAPPSLPLSHTASSVASPNPQCPVQQTQLRTSNQSFNRKSSPGVCCATSSASAESEDPGVIFSLESLAANFVRLFPLWIVLAAVVGFYRPETFLWFDDRCITYGEFLQAHTQPRMCTWTCTCPHAHAHTHTQAHTRKHTHAPPHASTLIPCYTRAHTPANTHAHTHAHVSTIR